MNGDTDFRVCENEPSLKPSKCEVLYSVHQKGIYEGQQRSLSAPNGEGKG